MYINAKRSSVGNRKTIVGNYGVNEEGDGDMYNKGMLLFHTLRYVVNNDAKWWPIIKGMCDTTFKFRNIGYNDVVNYFNQKTGLDLSPLFEQYLKHAKIPVLQYSLKKVKGHTYKLSYKWRADAKGFSMPFFASITGNPDLHITGNGTLQETTITLNREKDFRLRDDLGYFNIERTLN